jgi:hypothetical protein
MQGKGWIGHGGSDGVEARIIIFALQHEGLVFVVREISAADIASSVEPGFALIRESFRWN